MKKNKTFFVDIGNSHMKVCEYSHGVYYHEEDLDRNAINSEILHKRYSGHELIISSVVPDIDTLFFQDKSILSHFITHETIPLISINIAEKKQLGMDRLVTALAAYNKFRCPCLIIDSGTAATFCYVDAKGVYQGGAIFPGMKICSKSLNDYTSKIPLIWVEKTQELWGKSTEEAVKIGLYQGFLSLFKSIINQYKKAVAEIKIVGTGSGLDLFTDELHLDYYDPYLIFDGINIFYKHINQFQY